MCWFQKSLMRCSCRFTLYTVNERCSSISVIIPVHSPPRILYVNRQSPLFVNLIIIIGTTPNMKADTIPPAKPIMRPLFFSHQMLIAVIDVFIINPCPKKRNPARATYSWKTVEVDASKKHATERRRDITPIDTLTPHFPIK